MDRTVSVTTSEIVEYKEKEESNEFVGQGNDRHIGIGRSYLEETQKP
jgi:hypothetical protein